MKNTDVIALLCFAVTFACLQPTSTREEDRNELATMREEIVASIRNPICADVADCRSVGFGTKPCGGHWEYLVYSPLANDSTDLADIVTAYNAAEQEFNLRHNAVSTCDVVLPPQLECVENRCVAQISP